MVDRATLHLIIGLLETVLPDYDARKTQFDLLFYGVANRPDVDLSGPPRETVTRLVMALDAYGQLPSGQQALAALLEQMRGLFGADKQALIDDLIRRIGDATATGLRIAAARVDPPLPPPPTVASPKTVKSQRRLEAAMPAETPAHAKTEVRVKVSLPESGGLRDELPVKARSGQLIEKQDVMPATFQFEFRRNAAGELLPGIVCVEIDSDEFTVNTRPADQGECADGLTELEIPPEADSQTLIIFLTAKADAPPGVARVRVSLFYNGKRIAQTAVTTTLRAVEATPNAGMWVLQQLMMQLQGQAGGVAPGFPAVGPAPIPQPIPPQPIPPRTRDLPLPSPEPEPDAGMIDDMPLRAPDYGADRESSKADESRPALSKPLGGTDIDTYLQQWKDLNPTSPAFSLQTMLPTPPMSVQRSSRMPLRALAAVIVMLLGVMVVLLGQPGGQGGTGIETATPYVTAIAPTLTPTPSLTPTPTQTPTATPTPTNE